MVRGGGVAKRLRSSDSVSWEHHMAALKRYKNKLKAIGDGVEVKASLITDEGAGNGLFATMPFIKDALVTFFSGTIISWEAALVLREQKASTHMVALVRREWAVDGRATEAGPGVGGGHFANNNPTATANTRLVWIHTADGLAQWPVLKAKRAIRSGEEITFDYGKKAWKTDHT